MPDTTPNTEQDTVSTPAAAVEATPENKPEKEEKFSLDGESDEGGGGEEQGALEEQEVPRTEFMNLKEALVMGQGQLKRIPHLNPESLRRFLLADIYPILIEIADYSNWYIGDLHNRVMGLEMGESGAYAGESLSQETAEELINFIGMSLQIFGVILQSPKADPRLVQTAQLLTTQAPGLIAKVQDITMLEEPDEDGENYEDFEDEEEPGAGATEVLEPQKREPVQVAAPPDDAGKQEAKGSNGSAEKGEAAPDREAQAASEEAGADSEPADPPGAGVKEGQLDA